MEPAPRATTTPAVAASSRWPPPPARPPPSVACPPSPPPRTPASHHVADARPERRREEPALVAGPRLRRRSMIEQGLPVGNGRLGALASNDPARELLPSPTPRCGPAASTTRSTATASSPTGARTSARSPCWPRSPSTSPTTTSARSTATAAPSTSAQGLVSTSYDTVGRRPTGGRSSPAARTTSSSCTSPSRAAARTPARSRWRAPTARPPPPTRRPVASFGAAFANGLKYGAAVTAYSGTGTVTVERHAHRLHRLQGPHRRRQRRHQLRARRRHAASATRPSTRSSWPATKVLAAARHSAATLLRTHVADHPPCSSSSTLDLGTSSAAQRALDTWERLQARGRRRRRPTRNWRPPTCSSAAT